MAIFTSSTGLKQLFSEDWLNKTAKQKKFVKRKRDITPLRLVSSLVSALGDGSANSIAHLHRVFNGINSDLSDVVKYKPFHNKLRKQGFADLMQAVTQRAMALFQSAIAAQAPDKLKCFKQVLVQDGSSFAVHPELSEQFAGRFTKVSPAAVELHMTMSLLDDHPVKMTLTADKESERAHLPDAASMMGKLLLADAGYVGRDYMQSVEQHGGSFLMRNSDALNPTICAAYSGRGRELKKLAGLRLKELTRSRSKARVLDLTVQWKGYKCRAIRYWHDEEQRYLTWLTNLCRETYSADEIMLIYRLRWQVELMFKELKSHNNLHRFVTRQPYLVTGLVWGSLLSLLVKRHIGRAAQRLVANKLLSPFKIASSAGEWLKPIMKSLATKAYSALEADIAWAQDFIAVNCCRTQQSKSKQNSSLYGIYGALSA